eukprot:CAMPEP_0185015284 /NCGR_PEP_ID=MMETSP1098-20130426/99755_1 /TAXON_ID=89044 /ORGANISM="Spumella elongata, Strain CCAP 955/1" /LENGTH=592 /DNA_ID=CAMNT_0027544407 /DNA_START=60 /DNA_END=1839 /DNA_ORIENTATION=+
MGSGVSVDKDELRPILLSLELVDGSTKLGVDHIFRASFTNYLKSGIWLDRLSRLVPESQPAINCIIRGGGGLAACLQEYGVSHDKLGPLKCSSSSSDKSSKPSLHSSSKSTAFDAYGDLYSGDTTGFDQEELLVLLFTIVYPIYLSSYEFERYVKYGIEHGKGAEDDDSSRSHVTVNHHGGTAIQDTSSKRAQELLLSCAAYYDESFLQQYLEEPSDTSSKRAQELLLSCAAYYDESFLQQYLEEPSWIQRVCAIFRDHELALCITDSTKGGLPILFVNKTFCNMFGYSEFELVGQNLSILSGACTEMPQLTTMHSKIHSEDIVKFSITLQSKPGKPLFDLVAQKAVGSYSISAHFVLSKSSPLEALNMVDDVLILLSYLVKAPPLPSRPSWLPAPIVILARSASNALHAASPSSVRSRSSSSSFGGSRSRTHSAVHGQAHGQMHHVKDGKGTPTSVHSYGHGGVGLSSGSRSRTHSAVHGQAHGQMHHVKDGKGTPTSVHSFGHGGVGLSSGSGSAPSSFRSIRTGGIRRRSRGAEAGTPTSHRSGASGRSSTTREIDVVSAGLHIPVDVEDMAEVSVGETTHASTEQQHK